MGWLIIREYYNCKFPNILHASAVTFGNSIYYTYDENNVPENVRIHERKHVEQYKKDGVLGFLLKYSFYYLLGRCKGLNHWQSYYDIPYEIEAFEAERLVK